MVRAIVCSLTLVWTQSVQAFELRGPVTAVQDGDTFSMEGEIIRLWGIDAPENGQNCERGAKSYNCGAKSENVLRRYLRDELVCSWEKKDPYGRLLAKCKSSEGIDINRQMVRDGWALAFIKYPTTYLPDERIAQSENSGMWAGKFQAPWEFRDAKWKGNDAPDPKCPIKGNINGKRVKIYHTPWSRSYDRTRINTQKGERWFCDESEALAAGWRAPLR